MMTTTKISHTCSRCGGSGRTEGVGCQAPYLEDELSDNEVLGIGLFVANILAAAALFAITSPTTACTITAASAMTQLLIARFRQRTNRKNLRPQQDATEVSAETANRVLWKQGTSSHIDAHAEPIETTTGKSPSAVAGPAGDQFNMARIATPTSKEPFALDTQVLERKRRETADVQGLLAIAPLKADTDRGVGGAATAPNWETVIAAVPEDYAVFARTVLETPKWSRSDFLQLAHSHGVMADAALECINEAAQELLGDLILIQENDSIQLNPDFDSSKATAS